MQATQLSALRGASSRRSLLRGAIAAGAPLALLACGRRSATSSSPGASAGSTATPRRGGTIVHAGGSALGDADSSGTPLDPHTNTPTAARAFRLVYQGLLGYDPRTYALQPELAQKWEQVSPTELTFHLQPGVKWQNKQPVNGRELTADDIVFSLNRARSSDPLFVNASLFADVDQIQAPDQTTVRVTTKSPNAAILSYLPADPATVLAREVVQKFSKIATADAVVGTGAFIMKSVEEGVGGEYLRNPDYWRSGRPYLDGVRTHQFADQQAGYAALLAGQADFILVPGDQTKSYITKRGSGFTPEWFKDDGVSPMAQPNTRLKPMNDPRVTRALRLLVDHDEQFTAYIVPWFGDGRQGAMFCPALAQWDLTEDEYARLLEWKKPKDDAAKEAVSLLTAAGYSKDNPLTFELAGNGGVNLQGSTQLLQAEWDRLSGGIVKASLRLYDQATTNTMRANKTFTFITSGNQAPFPEPDAWFTSIYRTGASRNYSGFSDATFDAMIDKQRTILDVSQRKAMVRDMILYFIDHGPSTLLGDRYFLNGVNPRLHDYAPEFELNGRQYEWMWLES